MGTDKLNFSRTTISAITPPNSGRQYYRDERTRALVLDVQAAGTKTFQVYRKVEGKPTRIALGRFNPDLPETRELPNGVDPLSLIGNSPDLNVRMARKLAEAVNASIDRGVNPAQTVRMARRRLEQELTLRQAFNRYYEEHLVAYSKKTAGDLQNDFARYLGKVPPGLKKRHGKERAKSAGAVDWEQRKLSSISSADVRHLMVKLKDNVGSRTANKVLVLLRSIYNKMIEWHFYDGENPCAFIQKFQERSRDRFLTSEEIPKFFQELAKIDHQDFKDFVHLSLFTGARRSNVLSMRWCDLDFGAGIWTVPGEQSKNNMPLTIPLTSEAKTILSRRKDGTNSTTFVFPAESVSGHMSPPKKRWKALLQDAGISDLRLHDLRRSLGSWAAMTGASLPVIGKALGHKSAEATAVYARLQHAPVMEAMERATAAILDKTGVTQSQNKAAS